MAKASFTHRCGHPGSVNERNRREADRRAAYHEGREDCWECTKAARAQAAAVAAQQQGLPELTGSPKQIAWAESIRQNYLVALKAAAGTIDDAIADWLSPAARQEIADALALLDVEARSIIDSKTWIECRQPLIREGQLYAQGILDVIERRQLAPTVAAERDIRRAAYQAQQQAG